MAKSNVAICFNYFLSSGSASAVKQPGHFEVRKSSSQVRSSRVLDAAKGSPDSVAYEFGRGRAGPASLSFPFSFPPFLSLFASSPPLASLRSRTPKIQVGGLGSTVSSPQWPSGVWSRDPTEIEFGALNCSLKI